jgi:UDP:flavonoid glycosyltransferase YjiC (YdhE family)
LDSHPPSSVIYISFGTLARISVSQTQELALGLEASGHPFIWAVRPPADQVADASSDFLPEGFEKRMNEKKQGLLIRGWAPQLLILSHPSIGGFISHCGWNSIVESMSQGVPIIGWPMAADQFYNSKLLEEMVGMSVEICRGVDAELHRTKVESAVKLLMEEKRGVAVKKRAMEMREAAIGAVLSDEGRVIKGSSVANVDNFIEEINKLFCTQKHETEDGDVSMLAAITYIH